MITKMDKVQIIGPRKYLNDVVTEIYKFGKIHISNVTFSHLNISNETNFSINEISLTQDEVGNMNKLEEMFRQIHEILTYFEQIPDVSTKIKGQPVNGTEGYALFQKTIDELWAFFNKILEQFNTLKDNIAQLKEKQEITFGWLQLLDSFSSLIEATQTSRYFDIIGLTVKKKKKDIIELITDKVRTLTSDQFELFSTPIGQDSVALVITCPKSLSDKVRSNLLGEDLKELKLPSDYANKPVKEVMGILQGESSTLPDEIAKAVKELDDFAMRYYHFLKKMRQAVKDKIAIYGVTPKFMETKFTFIMIGWMPSENFPGFKDHIDEKFQQQLIIENVPVSNDEEKDVPVYLSNNFLVRPFELTMKLFPPPKYGTIDPTPYLAMFFPVIFGLILGDAAYGIIMFLIAVFLMKKYKDNRIVKDISVITMLCGASTVIWGILFGEFFGDLGMKLGFMKPILMNREEAIIPAIGLSVGVGFFQIMFGLALGVISNIKRKHSHKAIELGLTLGILLAIVILVVSHAKVGILPNFAFNPAKYFIIIAFIALLFVGGVVAPIEVLGTIGNIFSYCRIMAVGLSSVILALIGNRLGGMTGNLFLGIIIGLIFHTINFGVGIFDATAHGLRLHLVEFFGKFVEQGGKAYKPFQRTAE